MAASNWCGFIYVNSWEATYSIQSRILPKMCSKTQKVVCRRTTEEKLLWTRIWEPGVKYTSTKFSKMINIKPGMNIKNAKIRQDWGIEHLASHLERRVTHPGPPTPPAASLKSPPLAACIVNDIAPPPPGVKFWLQQNIVGERTTSVTATWGLKKELQKESRFFYLASGDSRTGVHFRWSDIGLTIRPIIDGLWARCAFSVF